MAENNNNQNFGCTGNCLNCQPAQRAYCASQHAYSNMKVLDRMMEAVLGMRGEISALREKIEAIQNNEASVFDPNAGNNIGSPDTNVGSNIGSNIGSKDGGPVNTPAPKSPLIH